MGFHDESGLSERPCVHTTWAVKGKTPVIKSAGSWKRISLLATIICRPSGERQELLLRFKTGSVNKYAVLKFLKELKKHLRRRKLLLIWDGLPAHKARLVTDFIQENSSWLKVHRFPAYSPELNPVEYLWSAMKKRVGNARPEVGALKNQIKRVRPKMNDSNLLKGFLKASKLYD